MSSGIRETSAHILTWTFANCENLGKLLYWFEPQFAYLYNGAEGVGGSNPFSIGLFLNDHVIAHTQTES